MRRAAVGALGALLLGAASGRGGWLTGEDPRPPVRPTPEEAGSRQPAPGEVRIQEMRVGSPRPGSLRVDWVTDQATDTQVRLARGEEPWSRLVQDGTPGRELRHHLQVDGLEEGVEYRVQILAHPLADPGRQVASRELRIRIRSLSGTAPVPGLPSPAVPIPWSRRGADLCRSTTTVENFLERIERADDWLSDLRRRGRAVPDNPGSVARPRLEDEIRYLRHLYWVNEGRAVARLEKVFALLALGEGLIRPEDL